MKLFTILTICIFTSAIVKAQTDNTHEPLIKQIKNGTVPGWKFAKNVPAPKTEVAENVEKKESLIAQIRKGTAPGMKFIPVSAAGSAAARATMQATQVKSGPLASEQEVKKEIMKIKPPVTIPTQEETKMETPANKE